MTLARVGSEIRVCVRLPPCAIARNLTALGLGAMVQLVADILEPLDDSCRVTLQLALAPAIAPRLGLEISSASPVGWKTILACLLARNLCTPEEARGYCALDLRSRIERVARSVRRGGPATG